MISDDGISSILPNSNSSIRVRGGLSELDLVSDNNSTGELNPNIINSNNPSSAAKRKRNLPGNPDPDAEVIALSPKSLMATNRFICEICNKGFQRDQNLQLHRRGHNLPWKLKQRNKLEVVKKKVYICPEKTCVHHDPSRALGDLTGIKKHFSRKHGEKKWKCEKCSKKYAVQSDWKAHSKICGTREYKCDCGTLFSRKDSFITHRAFCDALADESATRFNHQLPSPNLNFRNHELMNGGGLNPQFSSMFRPEIGGLESSSHQLNLDLQKPNSRLPMWLDNHNINNNNNNNNNFMGSSSSTTLPELVQMASQNNQWFSRGGQQEISAFAGSNNNNNNNALMMTRGIAMLKEEEENKGNNLSEAMMSALYYNSNSNSNNNNQQETNSPPAPMSATALLQKAAQMGSTRSSNNNNNNNNNNINSSTIFGTHGFGLMSSSFSSLGNFNTMKSSGIESTSTQQQQQQQQQQVIGGGVLMASTNNLQQQQGDNGNLLMSSRRMDQQSENGLTRDFLGVGGNNDNRRFLQENGMVKFASEMDMGHYSSRN
ncbi:hypothetical protein ACJIZ3_017974 [Penstemon smallii]|uniref:C2H2-type domain-containing protein n=1 Tax=Penstemon smallii TaxID=265156 RepID=A0ABD3SX22_9LAMI